MTSFKEDEDLLKLMGELINVSDKLEPDNSKIKLVLSVEERKKLEEKNERLYNKLITTKIEIDRIRIRETPYPKELIDFLRKETVYGPITTEDFNGFWDSHYDEILDFHEDNELIERGTFIRNYFELIPPYVKAGTKIPEGVQSIYHESRWCFVYAQYSAVIALSRSVIETVLKNKFHLEGKLAEIIKIAKNRHLINNRTAWNADKVRVFANKTLHNAKPATEDQAKDSINYVLHFLEEIYFS